MPRPKKITVSAMNIRIHPHTQDLYVDLLRDVFRMKRMIHVRGDQYVVMRLFGPLHPFDSEQYEGQLCRFTKIDSDLPWFNFETLDVAADSLVEEINIPTNVFPNLVTFSFLFFPAKHLLVFESYADSASISPNIIKKYLDAAFAEPALVGKYGSVKVDVFADHTKLDDILDIAQLKRLSIEINKPNSDHWDDELEADIEARLEEQNVRSVRIDYLAEEGQSIVPNDTTKGIAAIATSNGRVIAHGKDEQGRPVTKSTTDIPVEETQHYDPQSTSAGEAFVRAAHALLQRLIGLRIE